MALAASRYNAFTLIELIVVVGIIAILAALVLSTVGYARKKGARARAETEIAAMSAACENYKADNGVFPSNSRQYNRSLDATTMNSATRVPTPILTMDIQRRACILYINLAGDISGDRSTIRLEELHSVQAKHAITRRAATGTVTAISDPFGNSYGYSTAKIRLIPAERRVQSNIRSLEHCWTDASPTPNRPAVDQELVEL